MLTTMAPTMSITPIPWAEDEGAETGVFAKTLKTGVEEIHFKHDPETGLKAIIAIHNTCRGPALGGTRCLHYSNETQALDDVMRLAQGMSYKSAFADLPYGGGKAVLMRPDRIEQPDVYFECYGEFIETLNGRYITAVDVGTSVGIMDIIARKTSHVLGTSGGFGDPSLHTATGILNGITAAVKMHLNGSNLDAVTVTIQGAGKVGYHLARLLHQQGAELVISDINSESVQRCVDEFGAKPVPAEAIFDVACDVFSPCALGGIINADTIDRVKAKIICGAANNQLATEQFGDSLYQKQIFYVPDYVVNAGGLIHVIYGSSAETDSRIAAIYDSVSELYQRSQVNLEPSHRVANRIAEQRLSGSAHRVVAKTG